MCLRGKGQTDKQDGFYCYYRLGIFEGRGSVEGGAVKKGGSWGLDGCRTYKQCHIMSLTRIQRRVNSAVRGGFVGDGGG